MRENCKKKTAAFKQIPLVCNVRQVLEREQEEIVGLQIKHYPSFGFDTKFDARLTGTINGERKLIYEEIKGRMVEESTKEIDERWRMREISPQATK